MLGVAFAAQGVSQVGNFFETFTAARVAAFPAMQAMRRKLGSPSEKVYVDETNEDELKKSMHAVDKETGKKLKAILPEYRIDSRSTEGKKLTSVRGQIEFKGVSFNYPTRPDTTVLDELDLVVEEGKTTALVGPRYV
jgi:ATP-binding cassette subfamily B (MDR/TAP) protein 1